MNHPPELSCNNIIWPDDATGEHKKYILGMVEQHQKEKEYVYMLYSTTCGCDYFQSVLLDRFPMSYKIYYFCKECKKGDFLEQLYPTEFYIPLIEKIYLLQDLLDMQIQDGKQKHLLEAYQKLAKKMQNIDGEEKKRDFFLSVMDSMTP